MWKKGLVGIPQGFKKITVIYKKSTGIFTEFRRNFARNSAGIFHGIPPEFFTEFCQRFPTEFRGTQNSAKFFTEFRGILFRRKNSTEFHGIFQTEFLRNSGIPYENFDGNIIPPEIFLTE